MRILHTSDWHVGRTIRGRSREGEHAGLLREIVDLVQTASVDLVLVAGDQFDTAVPSAASERLVWSALADLVDAGARVVLVAGNHDNAAKLDALTPLLRRSGGVTVAAHVRPPGEGGVVRVDTSAGEARVALVPWLSQRSIVKTADLLDADGSQHAQAYADRVRLVCEALTSGFGDGSAVDVLVAHLTVVGTGRAQDASLGGGERLSQIFDYVVPPQQLPAAPQYIALGHLHQPHDVPGRTAIRYSGSPLALDFGERDTERGVTLVDIEPGAPPTIRHVPLRSGFRLLTIRGSLDELEAQAADLGERVHLRVDVDEPPRAGLAEDVRALVPQAVDVRLARSMTAAAGEDLDADDAAAAAPAELLADYLGERGITDPRVEALFGGLLEEWQERHDEAG